MFLAQPSFSYKQPTLLTCSLHREGGNATHGKCAVGISQPDCAFAGLPLSIVSVGILAASAWLLPLQLLVPRLGRVKFAHFRLLLLPRRAERDHVHRIQARHDAVSGAPASFVLFAAVHCRKSKQCDGLCDRLLRPCRSLSLCHGDRVVVFGLRALCPDDCARGHGPHLAARLDFDHLRYALVCGGL